LSAFGSSCHSAQTSESSRRARIIFFFNLGAQFRLTCTNLSAELSSPSRLSPELSDNSLSYGRVCLLLFARQTFRGGTSLDDKYDQYTKRPYGADPRASQKEGKTRGGYYGR
jgi:hypothetical protein